MVMVVVEEEVAGSPSPPPSALPTTMPLMRLLPRPAFASSTD